MSFPVQTYKPQNIIERPADYSKQNKFNPWKKSAETHIISYEETHLIPTTLADGGHPRYIQQINAYSQKKLEIS